MSIGNTRFLRETGLVALALLLLAGSALTVTPVGVDAQDTEDGRRDVGVIHDPDEELLDSLETCTEIAALDPGALIEPDDGVTVRIINGEPSVARYVAEEELANVGANTAIGETSAFIGQLLADADNNWVACSRFDVDMRTLVSDQSRRDNFLRNNTLESDAFPIATFILRTVEGLDGPMTDEDATFTLIGDFTFHGVTNLMAWEATAKLDGDALVGTAFTEFDMDEFSITPPIVGSVISIDETIRLEVDVDAQPAA